MPTPIHQGTGSDPPPEPKLGFVTRHDQQVVRRTWPRDPKTGDSAVVYRVSSNSVSGHAHDVRPWTTTAEPAGPTPVVRSGHDPRGVGRSVGMPSDQNRTLDGAINVLVVDECPALGGIAEPARVTATSEGRPLPDPVELVDSGTKACREARRR